MSSREMRLLQNKWAAGTSWPKRLEWLEIQGIRGWAGQRIDFPFPIAAIVGENGAGKSTIMQCLASAYRAPKSNARYKTRFASDFFPDTPWERITDAQIRWSVREGDNSTVGSVRKLTTRWRGNPERRERDVIYVDLSRIQPVPARVGYSRLAKAQNIERTFHAFDAETLARLSNIMGRTYDLAKMSITDFDATRAVPVISHQGTPYSGFHQGAGETTVVELLLKDLPRYSLVLIDEIETSIHPRAQRRLMRDLATLCRVNELQIVLTTHSPYVLEELPGEGRLYILTTQGGRQVIRGVSPFFALTQMDEEHHPECDLYVEDRQAEILLRELIVSTAPDLIRRCKIIPFGAAQVGMALGQMVAQGRFPRPSLVFLDPDQPAADGCHALPGADAPERVVFTDLRDNSWGGVAGRLDRSHSSVVDACSRAMTTTDHHDWTRLAADELVVGGDQLWQALCSAWAKLCIPADVRAEFLEPIEEVLTE